MRKVTLTRQETGDEGTFGTLVTDSRFTCRTGELPWRYNAPGKSCIPTGVYQVTWRYSPSHGMCYHVENVSGRTDIEIHSANWMGDPDKRDQGMKCQLLGCIAPGLDVRPLDGQKGVISSKTALAALEEDLGREAFELTIEEDY